MSERPHPDRPPRVLLVEDHPAYARLLELYLQDAFPGVDLHRAASLAQALEHLAAVMPDCVVTDLTLPDASGEDVVRRLREAAGAAVPMLVVSGRTDPGVEEHVLAAGAQRFLSKGAPSPEHDVVAAVRAALGDRVRRPAGGDD